MSQHLRIVFNGEPWATQLYHVETGKPFCGTFAFILTASATEQEAKILTDEPLVAEECIVEGECIVPVTEQLVITSPELIALLAKCVARELQGELLNTMKYREELETQLFQWFDELTDKEEAFIQRVAKRLKAEGVIA